MRHEDTRSFRLINTIKRFLAAVAMLFSFQAGAVDWHDSPPIGDLFKNAGVEGTFVLYDVSADTYVGHDRDRAERRFVPASTFKILNSLIGLSVGAVKSVDDVLPYGGGHQFMKAWEKDMGLREAIGLSNVPIYRELARRIGLARMRENLVRVDFGNNEVGPAVDGFWLAGPLKISAVEQARFLARLARDELPFSKSIQNEVREIVVVDTSTDWRLFGKTGWQNAPDPGIGWWVGWVQKGGRVYAFALNLDIKSPADANKRVELGRASLKVLGII